MGARISDGEVVVVDLDLILRYELHWNDERHWFRSNR